MKKETTKESSNNVNCENSLAWQLWSDNFHNAKRFFDSKGNIQTKSKLKDKWYKEFMKKLKEITNVYK